jgi:hypothetical protein
VQQVVVEQRLDVVALGAGQRGVDVLLAVDAGALVDHAVVA